MPQEQTYLPFPPTRVPQVLRRCQKRGGYSAACMRCVEESTGETGVRRGKKGVGGEC